MLPLIYGLKLEICKTRRTAVRGTLLHLAGLTLSASLTSRVLHTGVIQQNAGSDGTVPIKAEDFDETTPQSSHERQLATEMAGFSGTGSIQAVNAHAQTSTFTTENRRRMSAHERRRRNVSPGSQTDSTRCFCRFVPHGRASLRRKELQNLALWRCAQIWFEAEDYDERNPDTEEFYPVVDAAGAFGKAITRTGEAGGMIRWTFDIGAAGGKGGTWYFWARIINPANSSDYMLVEGDPGDPTIPTGPPFPGGTGPAPFVDTDDRIFEGDYGPPWAWGQAWDPEGHVKELRDGENTMYIFHRQGNDTVFWDAFVWTDSPDYVPTDADYQNATAVLPDTVTNPSPASGATDVPREVVLSWTQGAPGRPVRRICRNRFRRGRPGNHRDGQRLPRPHRSERLRF